MASRDLLCYACADIFGSAYDLTKREILPINHTKWTFLASVKEGCRLCKVICQSLYGWIYVQSRQRTPRDTGVIDVPDDLLLRCSFDTAFRNPDERSDKFAKLLSVEVKKGTTLQIHHVLQQYNLSIRMNVWNESAPDKQVSLIIHPLLRLSISALAAPMNADILLAGSLEALMQSKLTEQDQTASEENFELISRWLKNCKENHACATFKDTQPAWSPSRLVDVSGTVPRLVDTSSLGLKVPYLALSHCWGGHKVIKTTMEVLNKFKVAGIPPEKCTATFNDAFQITRRLGHQYIWIDSLCIIQDSAEDWSEEARSMSSVYGYSTLNLIAAHARDGRDGCFKKRDIHSVRPCLVPNPFRPVANESFIVYPMRMDKIYNEQVRNSPIYRRAWILQERLLSPRSVYFGKEQIFWACGEMEACEAFPSGANYVPTRPHNEVSIDKRGVQQLLNPRVRMAQGEAQGIAESWARIVKMYSSSELTFPADKLYGLSGIAERVQGHIGGEYLAGLWKNTPEAFLWSLLWFVDSHDKGRSRPPAYRAPSWTWTSVDGTIELTTPDPAWRQRQAAIRAKVSFEPAWQVKLVSASTEKTANYGMVTGGMLVVTGSFKTAQLRLISEEDVFGYEFFDAELFGPCFTGQTEAPLDKLCSCHIDVPSEIENMTVVTCLPIVEEKEQRDGHLTGLSRSHGLILQVTPNDPKKHMRIGHFATSLARDRKWLSKGEEQLFLIV
ncbi:hypothetical protein JMJ35_004861 [Cladonia borealis]|uniref:Heterokaryon incompatibility domain-containing protein n=1 Tax=Cladonia borealis TaxID=184061 RepID=A0AA39R2Y0_9LECA|nr:hypothetical protein JMJ35_004861 [Cladonia borealis]